MNSVLLLANHAVHYQAPLFQCMHEQFGIDLHVVYLVDPTSERPTEGARVGRYVRWDIPLTEGYSWSVLPAGNLVQRFTAFARVHRDHGRPPIMLTGWGTHLHWLVWTWAVLGHIPVLQGAETNRISYSLTSRPRWRHLWLRFLIRHTAALLCIGQRNREYYEWMGASPAHFYPYPYSVDNDRFYQAFQRYEGERTARLEELGLDPALPVLLFCGKLIPHKRPDLLLQAVSAAGLAQRVNLVFSGGGELHRELMAQAAELGMERVAFLGFLNQSKMPLAYVLGDLLCLLSVSETWGLVVNEALACGRPVLVSDSCGCVPDLVDDKGTGWVVSPVDLASTARALGHAVDQVALWPAMGKRGQAVVAHHTLAAMAQGVLTALRSL